MEPLRLALWSGPRSLSTALMRSWGNRPDTAVCDEPFYACYLAATNADHPGAREVVEHHETDWRKVVVNLLGPVPGGKAIFFQKHMCKHMLPEIDREWMRHVTNCFLIRTPSEVVSSFIKFVPNPTVSDLGLPVQLAMFEKLADETGSAPLVVDARDVLEDPRRILGLWCERLGIPFREEMLSWPAGPRDTDGVWGKHWYDAVEKSTGFGRYVRRDETIPAKLMSLLKECERLYRPLYEHRLR
jgi:hypothetical protein